MAVSRWYQGTVLGWADHAGGQLGEVRRDGNVAVRRLEANEASFKDAYPVWQGPPDQWPPRLFTERWRYVEGWTFDKFLAEQRGLPADGALRLLAKVRCAPDPAAAS